MTKCDASGDGLEKQKTFGFEQKYSDDDEVATNPRHAQMAAENSKKQNAAFHALT